MVYKRPVGEGEFNNHKFATISVSAILILASFAGIVTILHISTTSETVQAEQVSCFVTGTKISMADGSCKNIEDVSVGDMVLTVNRDTMEVEPNRVLELTSPVHEDMVNLVFEDAENTNTFDHPYFVKGKGWCSYKPVLTQRRYGIQADQLEVGDICFVLDQNQNLKETRLVDTEEEWGAVQTYNLYEVENNNNFFANGVLVHNKEIGKCFMPGTPINMADGSYKNIEDVELGDMVKVYDEVEGQVDVALVHSIQTVYHDNVHELVLENGKVLQPTANHPFLVKGKGWCTVSGLDEMGMGAGTLVVGDYLYQLQSDGSLEWVRVVDIVPVEGNFLTYNFLDMKYGTFIADDIITHNSITCFPAGTMIDMADGSCKNIEDVVVGDKVLSYDIEAGEFFSKRVYGLESPVRDGVYDVNGGVISPTCDHPIYIKKSDGRVGWGAMDAVYSKKVHGFDFEVFQIEVGDYFFDVDGDWVLIDSIDYRRGPIQVYTISVADTHTFYANDFLVHNCGTDNPPRVSLFNPDRSTPTNSLSVTVTCADDIGLSSYRYEWTTSTSTPGTFDDGTGFLSGISDDFTASAPSSDGVWYLHVILRDNAAQSGYDYSGSYAYDATDPTGSIIISEGDSYTNSRDVSLRLDYNDATSGVLGVNYSNAQKSEEELRALLSENWETPSADKSWMLSSGDESKTVYYYIKDRAANIYETSDTISLDTTSPSASILINDGDSVTNSITVDLSCTYSDSLSGVDQVQYKVDDGSWSGWEDASATESIDLPDVEGTHTVYYQVRDNVGNTVTVDDSIDYNELVAPNADFTRSASEVYNFSSVTFTDNSSDSDGSVVSYEWDLGDNGVVDSTDSSVSYTFSAPGVYDIKLTVTDNEGVTATVTKTVTVKEKKSLIEGTNYMVYRRNSSVSASTLADFINLETDESIMVYNHTDGDWDPPYIVGDGSDFVINRFDVVQVFLNPERNVNVDFGASDSSSTSVSVPLKYTQGNLGYNMVPYTKESSCRASDILLDLSLPSYSSCYIYNVSTDTYETYLKLPGDPTAGVDGLDPVVNNGDVVGIKIADGVTKDFDTSLLTASNILLN